MDVQINDGLRIFDPLYGMLNLNWVYFLYIKLGGFYNLMNGLFWMNRFSNSVVFRNFF